MKILVAPDSFKGSLSAKEAAQSIGRGIQRAHPEAQVILLPLADGGEGTAAVLAEAIGGKEVSCTVPGPDGTGQLCSGWTRLDDGSAVVEFARAAGLERLPPHRRNPLPLTSFGVGRLILAAMDGGAHSVIVAFGGSATCDGGAGILAALGALLADDWGNPIVPTGEGLGAINAISLAHLDWRIKGRKVRLLLAADVQNPFYGDLGAARVFSPQKGATPEQVEVLDHHLERFAQVLLRDLGVDLQSVAGSGAAGGAAGGVCAATGSPILSGTDLVLDKVGFDQKLEGVDLVVTGEGCLDAQTGYGKLVAGVVNRAGVKDVPVVALAGRVEEGAGEKLNLAMAQSINPPDMPLDQALAQAARALESASERIARLLVPKLVGGEKQFT